MKKKIRQAHTRRVSLQTILNSPAFARGLDEARRGIRFDADFGGSEGSSWDYERGRCFGFIAPVNMPLRIGTKLNPKAMALAQMAFNRRLLL